jgi:hypothetical protein
METAVLGKETDLSVKSTANINEKTLEPPQSEEIIQEKKDKETGFLGKFLTAWLLLILGAIIGSALYYFLAQPPTQGIQESPKIKQTPNIEYSAFEDSRRNVDRNPEQFIVTAGRAAKSAEDFYLLGRAYFITADYVKAKDAFSKAKELISGIKDTNRRTLENEVAIGLSIVENNIARNEFINQKRLMNPSQIPTMTPTQTPNSTPSQIPTKTRPTP